jgi:hypothetical protein
MADASPVTRRAVLGGAAAFALSAGSVALSGRAAWADSRWAVVDGPAIAEPHRLVAVKATSAANAWAVGGRGGAGGSAERSLTARWTGRRWADVASPAEVPLRALAGIGPDDLWAVGAAEDGSASAIQRWNGSSWSLVDHVSGSPTNPLTLGGVLALGSVDAIAVGFRGGLVSATPHAQHWDGNSWRELPVPWSREVISAVLTGVAGQADNVWATGFGITAEFQIVPYFVRWNGKVWSHVPAPSTIRGGYNALAMVGPDGFIAVGSHLSPDDGDPVPVVVSFDNGRWQQEPVPVAHAELDAVAIDTRQTAWAVGSLIGDSGHDGRTPLALRRSASGWSVAPTPATGVGRLSGITTVPGLTYAWAVGANGVTDETHRGLVLGYGITDHDPRR